MNPRKFILIDGTAVIYRSFYAIRDLSTGDGKPTNAVFGFIRMLKQTRDSWMPTHWAVVFDGGLPKERRELLETYKAQRPAMPDALREQIPFVEDYLNRAEIPWFRMQGEEADDVIATLAEKARHECETILIATSDKDIFQLIDDKIKIIPVAGKGGLLDVEGVRGKTGVVPSQIIDWLAMVGDSSDNIPGVPGIGAKTAAKLLAQFGKLDEVLANVEQITSDKIRIALQQSRDLLARNRAMVRLRRDLACTPVWGELEVVHTPSANRLLPFFEAMEFHSMAKEVKEKDLFIL
ncbi:MAG: 5'-3' exonuclease H3TH domain-containing protein [Kiritimatiellae bacterium]|nr:5'-3' exonuclease H3TH domain-containing protein [Kiritimatiellia bacterium]MDD5522276.1 5'-3' exonuclease H3TH domain-containing protein [Kiritimatiellia bacterium]